MISLSLASMNGKARELINDHDFPKHATQPQTPVAQMSPSTLQNKSSLRRRVLYVIRSRRKQANPITAIQRSTM